ncbi:pseudouridine synthase [Alicycliphilus denitrificans]|uniref:Pseudouridine synthase n=1 Tax=Alicycliphilus denitrificans TaxID=179636 RepID=A0A420KAE6_9BURK|nr:pseudouridine synthase [Alicycliphilus denitrificans]RKJ96175.1 rRNA pseudouridine synthase [Alicycliphilus denitrificans]
MNDSNKALEAAQAPAEAQVPASAEAPKARRPRARKPAGEAASVDHGADAPQQQEPQAQADAPPAPAEAADGPQRPEHRDAARKHGRRDGKPAPRGDGYRFADVVSGKLDQDEDDTEVVPHKRVLLPQPESPKLHKVLAQAGMGSRLEMEQLILEGRISVNNEPAHIGQRVQFGDQIKVNGKPIRFRIAPPPTRVIAYHKPVGEVVTHDDPQNRPTVFRKLPRLQQGKWQSVGRLDLNTEGLLLFTSSGELANKLMHPRFGLEREYAVRVLGALSDEERQRLLDGVSLDDGMASFGSIEDGGGEGANCWYRVTISEGRNREVRRMFEAVGHAVSRLIRIRYGAMMLPRGLKRGAWLELDEHDIRALMQAAGVPADAGGGARTGRNGRRGERKPMSAKMQGEGRGKAAGRSSGSSQPDPMKTSVGYIGADSFSRHRQQQQRGGGSRRGGR